MNLSGLEGITRDIVYVQPVNSNKAGTRSKTTVMDVRLDMPVRALGLLYDPQDIRMSGRRLQGQRLLASAEQLHLQAVDDGIAEVDGVLLRCRGSSANELHMPVLMVTNPADHVPDCC